MALCFDNATGEKWSVNDIMKSITEVGWSFDCKRMNEIE
jgi:hypothetical protein